MNSLKTTELSDFSVVILPEAMEAKADALALAKGIQTVTTQAEQQDAIAAASLMKKLTKGMESTRVEVKEPVLDAGRMIDTTAKKYSAELLTEIARVEKLAADFQREEDRKAAAIKAEQERIAREEREREAAALAKIAAEADKERLANLAAIRAATDEAAREAAQRKADADAEARAEEVRINQEAIQDAERARATAAMTVVPVKPQGATVKVTMDFELRDVRALYATRPDLCEVTPRRAMILAAISIPGHPAIPGIYEFESTKVTAKAS